MKSLIRLTLTGFILASTPLSAFALETQATEQSATTANNDEITDRRISKVNTYISMFNRSLRANLALDRYASWVDMKKGPTGKERVIYGTYTPYDLRSQIAKAREELTATPAMPELDKAAADYMDIYEKLAPELTKAAQYYERQDYKDDNMEGAKKYHQQIVALVPIYQEAFKKFNALITEEKLKIDIFTLNRLEKEHGKNAAWQRQNVLFQASQVIQLLPSNESPIVDMNKFSEAIKNYSVAVREIDDYVIDHPDDLRSFRNHPSSILKGLREVQEMLKKNNGDARKRNTSQAIQRVVNQYNTMISMSSF